MTASVRAASAAHSREDLVVAADRRRGDLLARGEQVARGDQLRQHDDVRARLGRLADGGQRQRPVALDVPEGRRQLLDRDARHAEDVASPARTRPARPGANATMAVPITSQISTSQPKYEYGESTPMTFL